MANLEIDDTITNEIVGNRDRFMKYKILFLGLGESYGGVEQFIFSICNSFLKDYFEFGFLNYYEIDDKTQNEINKIGAMEYRVSRYSKNPIRFLKEIYQFYHTNDEYKVIYCNASHASVILYAFPIWMNKGKKIVFHSHSSDGNHKRLHLKLQRLVNKFCTVKLACSEEAGLWMYGNLKNVQIIHNGIDTERFKFRSITRDRLRKKYNLQGRLVIGHVGRLSKVKNHDLLLSVFKEILKRKSNAFLVLIGEGELYKEIKSKILEMDLEKYVLMIPFQENIEDYYQLMDIFVLPSIREALPFTGIEAQASGLPVFYSDGVPKEADITDLVHYIKLKEEATIWAEKILQTERPDRSGYWEEVAKAGFDRKLMVNKVFDILTENRGN